MSTGGYNLPPLEPEITPVGVDTKTPAVNWWTAEEVVFFWQSDKWTAGLVKVLGDRLERCCELLARSVRQNLLKTGRGGTRSMPYELPHAESGLLAKSIFSRVDRKRLGGMVGTPIKYGVYLEFGTRSKFTIRPVKARALLIPITEKDAYRLIDTMKYRKYDQHGKPLKRANSAKAQMKRAGVVKINGKWFLFRRWAKRWPIRQRSFLRRTLAEQRGAIMNIMLAPLPKNVAGGNISVTPSAMQSE